MRWTCQCINNTCTQPTYDDGDVDEIDDDDDDDDADDDDNDDNDDDDNDDDDDDDETRCFQNDMCSVWVKPPVLAELPRWPSLSAVSPRPVQGLGL